MAIDYKKIRDDKEREYGTKVGNYGRLLANLYADPAHFILELLQNAEDALGKRDPEWQGTRSVSFRLAEDDLRVKHSGRPFDEADVRGICEIGESEKADDVTAIGRFGIGFKSVYKITNRPEIHSGYEDFAIENYVCPVAVPAIERDADDTVFLFPLKSGEEYPYDDIAEGLRGLRASTLLFLREIEEIKWSVDDGRSGHYLRETEPVEDCIRKVTVIGQEHGRQDVSEEWLVFSQPVASDEGKPVRHVEIAFLLETVSRKIQRYHYSQLVVFFPTLVTTTHVGFRIQGPYQTNPPRNAVPPNEPWNKRLVEETSELLIRALRWLRERGELTTDVLSCLPLRPGPSPMFYPLFDVTKQALSNEKLLPGLNSEYVSADRAMLGRTEGVRRLFSPSQLAALYGDGEEMSWLSRDITQGLTPEIRSYLMEELDVQEADPESITRRLTRTFLEAQPDDWIVRLYGFLGGQPAIVRSLRYAGLTTPIVRLEDGKHVRLSLGEIEVFLPGEGETDFPTVRRSVCSSPGALSFLRDLGLREPDLVDDVIRNLLPKYQRNEPRVDDAEYETDLGRILRAYATDSNAQREKLLGELRKSSFVRAVDAGTAKTRHSRPGDVYLPTERLKRLFDGVAGVWFVDATYECLRGESVHQMLKACGTSHRLIPMQFRNDKRFGSLKLREMRKSASGSERSTQGESVNDWQLIGLRPLLDTLPYLDPNDRSRKAKLLWESLADVDGYCFSGTYRWFFHTTRSCSFVSEFVELLNKVTWVPTVDGNLASPEYIVFEDLGWEENSFLQSKIRFKPSTVRSLEQASGFEDGMLDYLKKQGITTLAGLHEAGLRVAITEDGREDSEGGNGVTDGRVTDGRDPFAKQLLRVQTTSPSPAADNRVVLPSGGPKTRESARRDTSRSGHVGRTESHRVRVVKYDELGPQGKALADKFYNMVTGDYSKHCQICGKTFVRTGGGWQVNVIHVVPPREDHRTIHFGDLLGLCGWHSNLLLYGQWALLDPETNQPFEDANDMKGAILNQDPDTDDSGNLFVGLPIRFYNVYRDWEAAEPEVDELIHYSKPHWDYLCELLNT